MTKFKLFMATSKKVLPAFSLILLASCGGGGSSSSGVGDGAAISMAGSGESITLNSSQAGLVTTTSTTAIDGSAISTISLPGNLAKSMAVQTGKTILIPAGQDKRFPLGFAAVVGATATDPATGQVTAEVSPATLHDAYSKLSVQGASIPLSADNFVGAIAPNAISGGNGMPTATQAGLLQKTGVVKVFNGALTLASANAQTLPTGLDISKPDLALGEINLATEVKLSDLLSESEASKNTPYGKSGEAKVVINIKLSELKLTQKGELEDVLWVPYAIKSLDYKLAGNLTGEIKLTGGFSADLGSYNRAWKETEEQGKKLLGVTGKVLGLESKDKSGKIPLAGLVFSVPCAATVSCPVLPGQTQTPIRSASAGGVIVWLYLNAKGQITFEGNVGARVNAGFEMGASQPEGGELSQAFKFVKKSNDKNLLELPFVSGELKTQANLGISIDADAFLGGVRFLNLALDAGAQANLNLNAQIANVLPNVGEPWQWQGNACMTTSVGAGVVANVRLGIGGQVKTGWKKIDDKLTGRITYELQSPKEDERAVPGSHDVMGIPLWYTYAGDAVCFPKPTVGVVNFKQNGAVYTWGVTGENLPDDLELTVATAGVCTTKPKLTWNAADAGKKASFTCTAAVISGISIVSGSIGSAKATNIGGNTQWSSPMHDYRIVGNYPLTDCVKDNITGLVWEGKPTSGVRATFLNSGNNVGYTNYGNIAADDVNAYMAGVNSIGLCGLYGKWRLPTANELQGIAINTPSGLILDSTWFINTPYPTAYWTSTAAPIDYKFSYGVASDYAWLIGFGPNQNPPGYYHRSNHASLRLVFDGNLDGG